MAFTSVKQERKWSKNWQRNVDKQHILGKKKDYGLMPRIKGFSPLKVLPDTSCVGNGILDHSLFGVEGDVSSEPDSESDSENMIVPSAQ